MSNSDTNEPKTSDDLDDATIRSYIFFGRPKDAPPQGEREKRMRRRLGVAGIILAVGFLASLFLMPLILSSDFFLGLVL